MPKAKRRGRGGGADKEKPLLAVQGVLKLEKSFVPSSLSLDKDGGDGGGDRLRSPAPAGAPAPRCEHDMVQYSAGYEVGPANPFPQNEAEQRIFEEQAEVDRQALEFRKLQGKGEDDEDPPGDRVEVVAQPVGGDGEQRNPEPVDPDDPANYFLPPNLEDEAAFHNDAPLSFLSSSTKIPEEDAGSGVDPGVGEVGGEVGGLTGSDVVCGGQSRPGDEGPSSGAGLVQGQEVVVRPPEMEPSSTTFVDEEATTKTEQLEAREEPGDRSLSGTEGPVEDRAMLPEMKPLPPDGGDVTGSDATTAQSGRDMVLEVALQMQFAKNMKQSGGDKVPPIASSSQGPPSGNGATHLSASSTVVTLQEWQTLRDREEGLLAGKDRPGPQISEVEMQAAVEAREDYDARRVLESYWSFVRDNPHDFNGWTYLLQHVESAASSGLLSMDEVRVAYNAFLPLYPYCYAYWIRYSGMEKKGRSAGETLERALAVLHRGLEAIPLSVDLWLSYLQLYQDIYLSGDQGHVLNEFWAQCDAALGAAGLDYRSDPLWERCIGWAFERKDLRRASKLYHRLVAVPTKLYNKHWDDFVAFVRDHHPRDILPYDEYEELRYTACRELGLTYRPDPVLATPETVREVAFPEDRLKSGMKERIVAGVVEVHERCQRGVEARSKFEDRIKRTYFHVKPLDLKQLRTWSAYLDFEMAAAEVESGSLGESQDNEGQRSFSNGQTQDQSVGEPVEGQSMDQSVGSPNGGQGSGPGQQQGCLKKVWGPDGHDRIRTLFERCLIPCAKYEEFWIRYARYLESRVGNNAAADQQSGAVEEVRNVYKRVCLIHCPKRVKARMQWAAFEEEVGECDRARSILLRLNKESPLLIECSLRLVDLERRQGNLEAASETYRKLLKLVPQNRKKTRAWVAMKYARFLFKVCDSPDKALSVLRAAMKRERGEPRLYSQIVDVCYQRRPVDVPGVTAALELALVSPDLSGLDKFHFAKRKVEFMQEFGGDVRRFREACDQLVRFKKLCALELKELAKKKRELEQEERKLQDLEELKARTRSMANAKAKVAEAEGRLLCTGCSASMVPDEDGVYEFERRARGGSSGIDPKAVEATRKHQPGADGANAANGDILDLLDMEIPEEEQEKIKQALEEKTRYKEVAPTWELNIETYGYGTTKKRKIYDPDYEHVENAKFREYERLEANGYDEELKDPPNAEGKAAAGKRTFSAPGLGLDDKDPSRSAATPVYSNSDYVVPPKVPQLQEDLSGEVVAPPVAAAKGCGDPEVEEKGRGGQEVVEPVFELPPEIADPQKAPCINVPDWFIKEGGELCLSNTANGVSVIRYWPKFLSSKGNRLMFNRLRRYCKWHQKQVVKAGGVAKPATRLVAWYGPCDYQDANSSGLQLEKNLNWAPELLDLLHRLISMTRHEFNSCFCNLYRHGHDMCDWHSDVHPQLGRNPAVASVSLGAVRAFEFRKKSGAPNFIRFPLFPGSLLVMEGATQEDWMHCLPRDVSCKEERINLTFRIMYSVNKRG